MVRTHTQPSEQDQREPAGDSEKPTKTERSAQKVNNWRREMSIEKWM